MSRRERITYRDAPIVLESLLTTSDWDEIHDDDINVDPYIDSPPSRRSDAELSRVLEILDSLEGRDG